MRRGNHGSTIEAIFWKDHRRQRGDRARRRAGLRARRRERRHGTLDCAFNNAAQPGPETSILDCTDEEWDARQAVLRGIDLLDRAGAADRRRHRCRPVMERVMDRDRVRELERTYDGLREEHLPEVVAYAGPAAQSLGAERRQRSEVLEQRRRRAGS